MKKSHSFLNARDLLLFAIASTAVFFGHSAGAATTGFNQTGAGAYDYNTPANWVGGTINGIWDSSLTLTTGQTVTFASDTVLTTGLSFNYTGTGNLTVRGIGDRTVTLGGDLRIAMTPNAWLILGGNANQALNLDLAGDRTFTIATGKRLVLNNTSISGGNIALVGSGEMHITLASNTIGSDITVSPGAKLYFDSNTNGVTGTTRAKGVILSGGSLTVSGNATVNSTDTITNALTADGASGGLNLVTVTPNAAKGATLSAGSLARSNNGVIRFDGTNLGTAAPGTANVANILFTSAPSLTGGGGGAGSQNISIIPFAYNGAGGNFVTYDATNGIRALTAGEYDTTITSGSISTNNVMLAASSTTTLSNNATVNSLIMNSGTSTTLSGVGQTLTVTSGAVFVGGNSVITANLNFDSAQGVIGNTSNSSNSISGTISGSGGLVFYAAGGGTAQSNGTTLTGNNASTYTGATTILTTLKLSGAGALSSSSAVLNSNYFDISGISASSTTVGSLAGIGTLNLGAKGLSVGGNNSSTTVNGIIQGTGGRLTKTGTGAMTLTGINTYSGATQVTAGTLILSGTGSINNSAVTVNGGAFRNNSSTNYTGTLTFTNGTIGGTNMNGSLGGLTIGSGQTISPGNSLGTATTTDQTWAGGGSYLFEINNATGTAGADPGWDLLSGTGTLTLTATSGSQFNILLTSLTLGNIGGNAANFSGSTSYNWMLADFANAVSGFDAAAFNVNSSAFTNVATGTFSVALGNTVAGGDNTQLYLVYAAVPEPATWALLAFSLPIVVLLRRRRNA